MKQRAVDKKYHAQSEATFLSTPAGLCVFSEPGSKMCETPDPVKSLDLTPSAHAQSDIPDFQVIHVASMAVH